MRTAISKSHLVVIPTYNTGAERVVGVVRGALDAWAPVWVVVDGSSDGSSEALVGLEGEVADTARLRVIVLAENGGKGAAVLHALNQADEEGFTHALTMDADGQHPPQAIAGFMDASRENPAAMVLGVPVFDASAPALRVNGRKVSNFWANLETLWGGVRDSLFGFRVYPIAPLRKVMVNSRWSRRFDFDPEVAVRLYWMGVPPINIETPVRYFAEGEGVSQFRYLRDNALLTWMHTRLMFGFLIRLPVLVWWRLSRPRAEQL
ncbi:MAG: glycosyltransferase family 2 protein [Verrucomicrobiales bacterium]